MGRIKLGGQGGAGIANTEGPLKKPYANLLLQKHPKRNIYTYANRV